jgi:sugar lactone lactonase YvrE
MASGMADLLADIAYVCRRLARAQAAVAIGLGLVTEMSLAAPLLEDCVALRLRDQDGRAVVGVEDVALDQSRDRVLLSAHNRRARPPAEGGIYAWPTAAIAQGTAQVVRLAVQTLPPGGLRPHGIGLAADRLAVVNRTTRPDGAVAPVVDVFRIEGDGLAHLARHADPRLCRPNDVALAGDRLLVTNDRGHCGGPAFWLERVFNRPEAFVLSFDDEASILARRFRFANGIVGADGTVHVAATRGRRVHRLDGDPVPLPFAPDNLTLAQDGTVWAAGTANLWRFALFIQGWTARAGRSAVARLDGAEVTVWSVPDGVVQGATAALPVGGRLVIAAGWDDRVALCRNPVSAARRAAGRGDP